MIKLKDLVQENCGCGDSCCSTKEAISEKAVSKKQQKFMGIVRAIQKGDAKGGEFTKKAKDAAKSMKKKDVKKFASTKHKGLPTKVKKEELKRLIDKYGAKKVRETIMAVRPKSVTVGGYRMPEEPDFEYDPEKKTDEGFGGQLKGEDKKKFEKARKENAEQLGYKVTGTSDTKKQKLKMAHELKEGTCGYGVDGKLGDKPAGPHLIKSRKKKDIEEAPFSSPSQLPFSSPEAKQQVEKDIVRMGKILGKASQQTVKAMMDGVKSKKYDAMDLQRAIMSGPVRDTSTGQKELMRALWNRVRDGFRRYSKRGKLR